MTVKDLIIKLLEEDMTNHVMLVEKTEHTDIEDNRTKYAFDVDSVEHGFGMCLIKFTDWRQDKND